jgi:hypothetical protein
MSRLGQWTPRTLEERLDRMESLAAIGQLPSRYALAIDSRDMDSLVALFVPDVQVGRDASGREALKQWFTKTMRGSRTTVHVVANHIIDFDDADHAHGVVYCRDELERPERAEWEVGMLQYWDTYERVDGDWCFRRRRFHRWYLCDAMTRPSHGAGVNAGTDTLSTHQLPEAFDTWAKFWEDAEP